MLSNSPLVKFSNFRFNSVFMIGILIVNSLFVLGPVHATVKNTWGISRCSFLFNNSGDLAIPSTQRHFDLIYKKSIHQLKRHDSSEFRKKLIEYAAMEPLKISEKMGTVAAWGLISIIATRFIYELGADPHSLAYYAGLVPVALLAGFTADVLNGVVHKSFDSFVPEEHAFLGSAARHFRIHHEYPLSEASWTYFEKTASIGQLISPFFIPFAFSESPYLLFGSALVFTALLNANVTHVNAHIKNPNVFFKTGQKLGIFVSNKAHRIHHKEPHNDNMGAITGWSNLFPIFDRAWKLLEPVYYKHLHRLPNNWIQDPAYIPENILKEILQDLKSGEIAPNLAANLKDIWFVGQTYPQKMSSEKMQELLKETESFWSNP